MTTGSVLSAAITQELRDAILGDVIMPGDEEYEQARSVWNGLIDRHPAVVVRCAGAADVLAAVRFARDRASSPPPASAGSPSAAASAG